MRQVFQDESQGVYTPWPSREFTRGNDGADFRRGVEIEPGERVIAECRIVISGFDNQSAGTDLFGTLKSPSFAVP